MAKPVVDISWATSTRAEEVIDSRGNIQLAVNKVEPDNAYKIAGIPPQQPIIRNFVNYWKNAIFRVLTWEIQKEVGAVLEFADSAGMTAAQLMTDRGGTWVDQGTYTKAGLLTRVFVKTA